MFSSWGSLISWENKKQTIVAHSSTDVQYHALAYTNSELLDFIAYYKIWVFPSLLPLPITLIIKVVSILLSTMYSMSAPNILKLIVASLTTTYSIALCNFIQSPLLNSMLIYSPRLILHLVTSFDFQNSSCFPASNLEFERGC